MGRPREFDPDQALEQAMIAFWRHGYLGTGIQELVATTGINRASLYGAFGNKEQLFLAALARYSDLCVNGLAEQLKSASPAAEGIRAMLNHFMEDVLGTQRGCMLYNTALEISMSQKKIRDKVGDGMQRIETLIVDHLRQGQRKGEIAADLEPMMVARLIMAAMQSMTVRGAARADREVLQDIRDGAMLVFDRVSLN